MPRTSLRPCSGGSSRPSTRSRRRPVFVAPGNHDFAGPGGFYDGTFLEALGLPAWPANVTVFRSASWETLAVPGRDDATVTGRAFLSPLLEAGRPLDPPPSEARRLRSLSSCSTALSRATGGRTLRRDRRGPPRSRRRSSSAAGFSWAALGHHHTFDVVGARTAARLGAYSGSPTGRGLDETGPRRLPEGDARRRRRRLGSRRFPRTAGRCSTSSSKPGGETRTGFGRCGPRPPAGSGRDPGDVVRLTVRGRPAAGTRASQALSDLRGLVAHLTLRDRTSAEPEGRADRSTAEGRFALDLEARLAAAPDARSRRVAELAFTLGREALLGRLPRSAAAGGPLRIERLVIDGFGPLEGVDLSWGEAELLLVLEPNETGKSTLCEAIVAALYGLPKGRTASGRSREARKPRSGAPSRLRLEVSAGGGRFTVERDFDAGTLRVFDRDRGEDRTADFLRPGGRDAVGEKLTGLTEPLFRTTAYVGQNVLDGDALDASLTVELARIADSGGGEASVVRALRLLDAARARMPEATTGAQVSVETEIVRAGRRVEEKRAEAARLAKAREAAAEAAARLAALTSERDAARRAAALAEVAVVESERRSLAAEMRAAGCGEDDGASSSRRKPVGSPGRRSSSRPRRSPRWMPSGERAAARPETLGGGQERAGRREEDRGSEDRERRRRAGGARRAAARGAGPPPNASRRRRRGGRRGVRRRGGARGGVGGAPARRARRGPAAAGRGWPPRSGISSPPPRRTGRPWSSRECSSTAGSPTPGPGPRSRRVRGRSSSGGRRRSSSPRLSSSRSSSPRS